MLLYNENGMETEYEIVDTIKYEGATYLVLYSEELKEKVVVKELNKDDYETVEDERVLSYVLKNIKDQRISNRGNASMKTVYTDDDDNDAMDADDGDLLYLYDEDGNELEFEIADRIEYRGKIYCVLWSEENESTCIMEEDGDEYSEVEDEDILSYVKKQFAEGMTKFMTEVDEILAQADALSDELDDMLSDDGKPIKEIFDEETNNENDENAVPLQSKVFDPANYIRQSQDYLFAEGVAAYARMNFREALEQFKLANEDGNIFAAAYIGILYHYGYGCEKDDIKALHFFKEGKDNGCPLASAWVSEYYRNGWGVEKDKQYAEKLYVDVRDDLIKMCVSGDMAAQYFYGYNLIMGVGEEINDEEGAKYIQQSHDKGNILATIQLAECYLRGWGVPENKEKTIELLQHKPAPFNKKAQYLLGLCYYWGYGTEKDYKRAFFHFKAAASLGHGRAKDYLGDCYRLGHGTSINLLEAARWYKDAADNNGVGSAAESIAVMYLTGDGVEKDERRGMDYYLLAAEKGIVNAQKVISHEYLIDGILGKDYEKAKYWMEKAAEKGDMEAQTTLGKYYVSGFGFDDDEKAFSWFLKAATQGYTEAEYIVGGCYENEMGVLKNDTKANEWYAKAAEKGHGRAKLALGISYLQGNGIKQDSQRGIDLILQALDAGIQEANRILALQYYYGINNYKGKERYTDFSEAYKYALEAAKDERDGEMQFILASLLHKSHGKITEAKEWYRRAAMNGKSEAKLELSKLYIDSGENYKDAIDMLHELAKDKNGEAQYYLGLCYESGYGCSKDKKAAKSYYQAAANNGYAGNNNPRKKKFGLF